jgi:hypothetical protein
VVSRPSQGKTGTRMGHSSEGTARRSFVSISEIEFFRRNGLIFIGLRQNRGRGWGKEEKPGKIRVFLEARPVCMADLLHAHCAPKGTNHLQGTCDAAGGAGAPRVSGLPPFPQKEAERMGHTHICGGLRVGHPAPKHSRTIESWATRPSHSCGRLAARAGTISARF